jgi:flagellar biosynthetic protein FliO
MANPIEPMQWLSMIASFVFVIGLLFATLWVLRRMGGRSLRGQGGRITVVESVWLAPRQRIALVRIDDQELLIGITQQQISMLTVLQVDERSPEHGEQTGRVDPKPEDSGGVPGVSSIDRPTPDSALTDRFRQALRSWSRRGAAGGPQ